MAVTLFHRNVIVIRNKVTIVNKNEEPEQEIEDVVSGKTQPQEITAKIRGKMYARRTVNR